MEKIVAKFCSGETTCTYKRLQQTIIVVIVIIIIIITPHTAHHLQFICSLVLLRSRLVDAVFGYSKIDLFTIAGWLQPVRHISCSVTTSHM